jgi:hypothetical protein
LYTLVFEHLATCLDDAYICGARFEILSRQFQSGVVVIEVFESPDAIRRGILALGKMRHK